MPDLACAGVHERAQRLAGDRGVALERVGDQPEGVYLGGAGEVLAGVPHGERVGSL